MMKLKQIIIIALCVLAVRTFKPTCYNETRRCYNETELERVALKKLQKYYFPRPVNPPASADPSISCPVDLYQKMSSLDVNERSLSPWKYVTVTRPDYFPSTYTEAKCLCSGCILVLKNGTAIHSSDYNTKPLIRTWVFLKRIRDCCEEGRYRLDTERVKVSVGCTCVRAKTVTS